jgi:hypothetical protein
VKSHCALPAGGNAYMMDAASLELSMPGPIKPPIGDAQR